MRCAQCGTPCHERVCFISIRHIFSRIAYNNVDYLSPSKMYQTRCRIHPVLSNFSGAHVRLMQNNGTFRCNAIWWCRRHKNPTPLSLTVRDYFMEVCEEWVSIYYVFVCIFGRYTIPYSAVLYFISLLCIALHCKCTIVIIWNEMKRTFYFSAFGVTLWHVTVIITQIESISPTWISRMSRSTHNTQCT